MGATRAPIVHAKRNKTNSADAPVPTKTRPSRRRLVLPQVLAVLLVVRSRPPAEAKKGQAKKRRRSRHAQHQKGNQKETKGRLGKRVMKKRKLPGGKGEEGNDSCQLVLQGCSFSCHRAWKLPIWASRMTGQNRARREEAAERRSDQK